MSKEDKDHRGTGARLRGAARARGGALGRRRTGTGTASTSERTEDLDRASAGRARGRQANPVVGGRDVGRERHGGDDATVAVPTMRIFGPAFLADCAGRPKPTTKATHAHNMQRSIRRPSATVASMRSLRATCGTGSTICRSRERLRANRSLTVQSSLRKHAEYLGLRPKGSNPCRGGGAHDLRHSHASHVIMTARACG